VVNYAKKSNRLRTMVAQTQKGVSLFAMFPFPETSFIPGYYGKKSVIAIKTNFFRRKQNEEAHRYAAGLRDGSGSGCLRQHPC
jgi:hypothetical protein